MKNRVKQAFTIILVFLVAGSFLIYPKDEIVSASNVEFNKNLLIQDNLFTDTESMSVAEIQNWLEGNGGGLLANWRDNVTMRRPSDNCVVHHPTGMTAAEIIYEAATAWNAQVYDSNGCAIEGSYWGDEGYSGYKLKTVSPKVLLVTLQKEQSLISTGGGYSTDPNAYKNPACCSSNEYKLARAMGYGVPDSGAINEKFLGFYNQVNWAAWQLRFNYERSSGNTAWDEVGYLTYTGPMIEGTWRRCSSCTPESFDGFYPIDGQVLYMQNRATASLYFYTPHTYPGFFGNYNFVQFYNDWFGNPLVSVKYKYQIFSYGLYQDSARQNRFSKNIATVAPGETFFVRVRLENLGSETWSNTNARLGTSYPNDRNSRFSNSDWISANRAVSPNESNTFYRDVATFDFSMTAPADKGSYNEDFALVIEGKQWIKSERIRIRVDVTEQQTLTEPDTRLLPGQSLNEGEFMLSRDRHSSLAISSFGILELRHDFRTIWKKESGNSVRPNRLVMQGDGNLVLYRADNSPIWNSQTQGNAGAYAELMSDGRFRVVTGDGLTELWSTDTSVIPSFDKQVHYFTMAGIMYPGQFMDTANGKYRLEFQRDGNLVLYSPNRAIWATYKLNDEAAYLKIQNDGNMVAYDKSGNPYWASWTNEKGRPILVLQQDGNLVLYNEKFQALWNTQTSRLE